MQMSTLRAILGSLGPTRDSNDLDRFRNRWTKLTFCLATAAAFTALLAASLRVLDGREGNGTALEWLGPAVFAVVIWLALGQSWLYYTLRHALWSAPHIWLWWRATRRSPR